MEFEKISTQNQRLYVLVITSGVVALLLVWGVLDSTQNDGLVFPPESHRLWYRPFQGSVKTCVDSENSPGVS